MKIVVLDGYTENPGDLSWESLAALGELKVYDRTPEEQAAARIGDAQIVITNKTPLSAQTIAACPEVRYIGVLATGYNVVDIGAARKREIPVCNIPSYGTAAVAQFVFALLLELCHRVQRHSDSVYAGEWSDCPDFCYWKSPLIELSGKTMGIIGFGRIGRAVAKEAIGFGMRVIAFDEHPDESGKELADYKTLEELLARSDVISLHCPLFPSTQGIINKDTIGRMKDGAMLINTSRGQLIVEQDLAEALRSGKIHGAAVDVVSSEPIRRDNPLLNAPNCLITPHIAWAPKESRARLMDIAVENVRRFLEGAPINVVN